jgi:peptidoglycan/xylan/chitin deacetylase (PgdA/CDA1 family)
LPGRAIILTFDDGYVDFADNAWPILQHHSMGATLFVVTDKVGGVADWDGVETPLLDWQALARLREQGLEIGAHGASHTRLTRAPISVAATEGKRARAALNEHLGVADPAFCYPHGGGDAGVRAAIRTSGFTIGLSATPGVSNLSSDIMALPRIEVDAGMSLETFARRLGILDGLR